MRFDFSESYVLENERARLEPLNETHFDKLGRVAEEKEIWTYFLGSSNGVKDSRAYFKRAITGRQNQKAYAFAIFDKAKEAYAGSSRFFDFAEDFSAVRIGYTWYGKHFRGTGLNKHCKYLMFKFAFEHLLMERVGLGAHAENKISLAAMKSVGCQEEGVVRNLFPSIHSTGRSDAILLGILKQEWFTSVKDQLKEKL